MRHIIILLPTLLFVACSSAKKEGVPPTSVILEEKVTPSPASVTPAPVVTPKPMLTESKVVKEAKPVAESGGPIKPKTEIWKLQKGKLVGPFAFGHPSVISKSKNKKGNGTTTETCYRYATFAVVEMRSSDEVGAAELTIRHDPPKGFALCQTEFKGKTSNLRIGEGYFAGVAGGLIMVDGADSSEGQTEFQLFQADSGLEVMKSFHHPTEEFTIMKSGDNISVEYFAKMAVKCELAKEGESCWKKVLAENKVVGKTPMPDCQVVFDKTKTPLTEPALVFTRARIGKLGSPPKFLGGPATCQPAP